MELTSYLEKAYDFDAYLDRVERLMVDFSENENQEQKELYSHVPLNLTRIKRLTKSLKFSEDLQANIHALEGITYLVISEGWCGDASQILPVLKKMAEINPKIELKTVFRDENLELIEAYAYNNTLSIPIVIGVREGKEVFRWGPRPVPGLKLALKYKAEEGYTKAEFGKDLQKWYNKDKGVTIVNEIVALSK